MDWQTITTIFILTIAAAILLNRIWGFLRSGKAGSCGSCGGCGGSSKGEPFQIIQLGTGGQADAGSPKGNAGFR